MRKNWKKIVSLICFSIYGTQLLGGEDGIRNYGSEMPSLGHAISIDQAIIDYQSDTPSVETVSYPHLRAHETRHDRVCRLLLE